RASAEADRRLEAGDLDLREGQLRADAFRDSHWREAGDLDLMEFDRESLPDRWREARDRDLPEGHRALLTRRDRGREARDLDLRESDTRGESFCDPLRREAGDGDLGE